MKYDKRIRIDSNDSIFDRPIDLDSGYLDNELVRISAILGKDGYLEVFEITEDEHVKKIKEAVLDKETKVETHQVRRKNAFELEDLLYKKYVPEGKRTPEAVQRYDARISELVQRAKEKGVEREFS